ncbi:VanZ family protein [Oceanithermus sp.]
MRWGRLLLALVWAMAIYLASAQPGGQVGLSSPWDKFAHAAAFGVLAWLLRTGGLPLAASLGLTALYALSDEFHQLYVPGRQADLLDWLADVAGAMISLGIDPGSDPAIRNKGPRM